MTRAYFKGAVGALVVFDLGDAHTYSAARKWKADIDKKCALPDGRKIPAILIANKASSVSTPDRSETRDPNTNFHCSAIWSAEWGCPTTPPSPNLLRTPASCPSGTGPRPRLARVSMRPCA